MKKWNYIVLIILVVFSFLTISSATRESLTFDEIVYTEEGLNNLVRHTFEIDPYNPPLIRELTALPLLVMGISSGIPVLPPSISFLPRLVTVFLGIALLAAVFFTAKRYGGITGALFATAFLASEPTFLAHSHYNTPDVGLTLFVFLAFLAFLRVIERPSWKTFLLLGATWGLAFASKISAIPFLVVSSFVVIICFYWKNFLKGMFIYKAKSIVSILLMLFVIWGTYGFRFRAIVIAHENPNRVSNKIILWAKHNHVEFLANSMYALQNMPVPLGDYIGILKNNIVRSGEMRQDFFLGNLENPQWYFLPTVFLLKTPLPFLVLSMISLGICIKIFRKKKNIPHPLGIFVLPTVGIVSVAILSHMNPLVRYLLPLYPFLAISSGLAVSYLPKSRMVTILLGLLLWQIIGTARVYPHFLGFANELVFPRNQKYFLFTDSNIDWGQGLKTFASYIEMKQPSRILFSYFGRDLGPYYGFTSDQWWGSYKNNEICMFHDNQFPFYKGASITAISISNWHGCGYKRELRYQMKQVKDIVGDSILIF